MTSVPGRRPATRYAMPRRHQRSISLGEHLERDVGLDVDAHRDARAIARDHRFRPCPLDVRLERRELHAPELLDLVEPVAQLRRTAPARSA